ncbi:MAG: VWA domain-containing protein [Chloroflexota bacterium]|nr:VWA domain-containing protein [Chloroflexota bacterium]
MAGIPLLAAVVALYLLKLRRPSAPVGSLYLWESLTRDREANSLWQRLQVSWLLLLQLFALALLILALARPWVPSAKASGGSAIVVVDVSASMGASEGGLLDTRLKLAQEQAEKIVGNIADGGMLALITTAEHAQIAMPPTADKSKFRSVLAALQVEQAGTDMTEATDLARALAAQMPEPTLYIVSDGQFAPVDASVGAVPFPGKVSFVPVGSLRSNQGITALSLDHQAGAAGLSLFVQVTNSDPVTVSRRVDLSVDDQLWSARTVSVGAGATQEVVVEDVPLAGRVIEARLAGADALGSDDAAWTVNRASAPAAVLLVSGGNKFLELSMSMLPNVTLYKVSPQAYRADAAINGAPPDLTVLDADVLTSTLQALPSGNLLMLAPRSGTFAAAVSGVITSPVAAAGTLSALGAPANAVPGRDPLLKYVDLSGLHVEQAMLLHPAQGSRVVLGSDKGPLITADTTSPRKYAIIAFDLHSSDLPVQTAFPLLMRNLVTALLPDPTGGLPVTVKPGSVVLIDASLPGVDKVLVEDPSAKEWSYPVTHAPRLAYAETSRPGVYYVTQYAAGKIVEQEAFTVNLFSHDEAVLQPNSRPGMPRAEPAAPGKAGEPLADYRSEIWPQVAAVGLLVLLVEWFYAQRIALRRAIAEARARRAIRKAEHR